MSMRHGHARETGSSPTYTSWENMIARCYNSNSPHYVNYGGRGITVCDRWRDFRNFLADMGERPDGFTLDRVNVDGNYQHSNCRWATRSQQQRNRRIGFKLDGVRTDRRELAYELGVSEAAIIYRSRRGLPIQTARLSSTRLQGRAWYVIVEDSPLPLTEWAKLNGLTYKGALGRVQRGKLSAIRFRDLPSERRAMVIKNWSVAV